MLTIEWIGSIDKQCHYPSSRYVIDLLQSEKHSLQLGSTFVGRPDTRIYSNAYDVVKIRAELKLSKDTAYQWTVNELKKEQKIAVHHPHKTWFISYSVATESTLVGSICPRLNALHVVFKKPPQTIADRLRYVQILTCVFKVYLNVAKTKGYKLDEGLSNFAIDDNDQVYYLDDEYYSWDGFISFAVMLGVFIRNTPWLDHAFMQDISDNLVALIDQIFNDSHNRIVISAQLQSLFMPSDAKHDLLTILIQGFNKTPLQASHSNILSTTQTEKKPLSSKKSRYFAVMADIHSNEIALDCVLEFYQEHGITQGIILGDIVGYGPSPAMCIDKLQSSPFKIIKGNHDHAVVTGNTNKGFSKIAKIAINWTIEQLNTSEKEWLKDLPAYRQQDNWLAVHGAPIDPEFFYAYVYLMTANDNLDILQDKKIPYCFHGHSHMPGIFTRKNQSVEYLKNKKINLSVYPHSLICPGSVGQPRNGNSNAQCAIYDREQNIMEWFNLPYAVDTVVQRIKQHNLPEELWQRLLAGK